jgi:hypothetical protein
MKTRLVPKPWICSLIVVSVPVLTEIMMMTAETPMITPNMVSNERNLFRLSPFQAI